MVVPTVKREELLHHTLLEPGTISGDYKEALRETAYDGSKAGIEEKCNLTRNKLRSCTVRFHKLYVGTPSVLLIEQQLRELLINPGLTSRRTAAIDASYKGEMRLIKASSVAFIEINGLFRHDGNQQSLAS